MKKLLLMIAAVGLLFTACDKDSEHDFIEYDYSEALIGTWTYVADNGQAEAMVINPDGSFEVTGIMKGGNLYEERGIIEVVNNKVSLVFDGDTDVIEGRLELVAGKSLSIVINDEYDIRLTYDYCENDFSEEIVGMWVCTNTFADKENDMLIQTFNEDGTAITTGYNSDIEDFISNAGSTYKVIGNLFINIIPADAVADGIPPYMASILDYTPNGTAYGDIMTVTHYLDDGTKNTDTFLRIRQSLDLANKNYDYSNIYITNVKAKDAEFEFAGQTLNLATMDGKFLDKLMKNILFNVSFPTSDEIVYDCYYNGESVSMPSPIVVDGNKMTIKKSAKNPAFKDIDVWAFQDQNNTQMHMYMPTYAFENFIANTAVELMAQEGKLDLSDAEAVAAIYDDVADAIETINVSFIFKDSTRAL